MSFDLSKVRTEPSFGHLFEAERELVHGMVLARRPRVALEVGTWKGGGSTFQIVSALTELGAGHLHTCEPDEQFFAIAQQQYHGAPNITLHRAFSHDLIERLIAANDVPEFIFFDGPDDPGVALADLQRLEQVLQRGCIFMMHDWDDVKASAVRPYLERSPHWQVLVTYTTAWLTRMTRPQHELHIRLARQRGTAGIVAAVRRK